MRIQPADIHRIVQSNKEKIHSLSDAGLHISETQRLLDAIGKNNDRFQVKYREGKQIMDSIFYWDPSDVRMAQRFCQVLKSIPRSRTILGAIHYLKLRLQQMR